jgi:trigger factor
MKVDVTDVSPVKKTVSIEVDPETVRDETNEVLKGYARQAKIPGFRPGKAPMSVIRSRFAKEVREDVQERVMARSYQEAMKEHGLHPLGDPRVEDVEHEEGQAFRFKTTVEVLPELEIKSYRGIEVRRPPAVPTPQEIDESIEQIRESRVQLITEEDREAATGDVIVADVEGAPEDGEPFNREAMMIEVGAKENLPAFNEHLSGAKSGAELEFSVDYPEDYGPKELSGKSVRYRLNIQEVKRRQLPELDDEFAKDLGDFDGIDALRAQVEKEITDRKARESEQLVRQRILDKVLLENPVVLPEVLVESEVKGRLEDGIRNLMMQGIDPEKAEIDWVELRKSQEEPARKSVHARLALDVIARAESITVDAAEVDARITQDVARLVDEQIRNDPAAMAKEKKKLRGRLEKQGGLEALKSQMVREKSLDLLTSVANIQNEE